MSGPRDVDDLLPLTLSRPREALARARAVLAGRPGPYDASVAHQAAAIVLREFGDIKAGVRELRAGAAPGPPYRFGRTRSRCAVQPGGSARLRGPDGGRAGRLRSSRAAINRCPGGPGAGPARRRALYPGPVSGGSGRPAARGRRAAARGDLLWTARALNNRALVYLGLGSTSRADADFVSAARLFSEIGQELEAIYPVHNRALVAFASGDLPAALAFLDAADSRLPAAEGADHSLQHRPVRRAAGGRAGRRCAGRSGRRGA